MLLESPNRKMRKVFINDSGRLRSGWRALIFACAFLAALLLILTVLQVFYFAFVAFAPQLPRSRFIPDLIYRISLLSAGLGAGYLCARWLEGLNWRSLGVTLHQGWVRDLVIGYVAGFASLALAVGIAAAGNGFEFSISAGSTSQLGKAMLGSAIYLCVAALAEEAIFRGYPLQTFLRPKLVALGIAVTSVGFGLVHLQNPNVTVTIPFFNTILAGVWFAVAYLRTRSLWLPLGLHWSWNWALAWFFGIPVSGARLVPHSLFEATDLGPAWLTGGNYGIEGGIAGTVALLVSTIFFWRAPWLRATPELKKLTSEENPAMPEPVVSIRSVD